MASLEENLENRVESAEKSVEAKAKGAEESIEAKAKRLEESAKGRVLSAEESLAAKAKGAEESLEAKAKGEEESVKGEINGVVGGDASALGNVAGNIVPPSGLNSIEKSGWFSGILEKEAELTGINVNEIMDETLQFTKKSKAKFMELTEAAKGAETIPLTILSAAHSRMKNNMHHDSGKWEYASHE